MNGVFSVICHVRALILLRTMNGQRFLNQWHLCKNFLVEVETIQSHRYSSHINYNSHSTPEQFKFYVLYVTKSSADEFSMSGFLHCPTNSDEWNSSDSSVIRNWIHLKNVIIKTKHCKISILDVESQLYQADVLNLENHLNNCPEKFAKVGNNSNLHYGDGGHCVTDYSLFFSKNLCIKNTKKLTSILLKIGKERNDWNPKAPVLDIIDPDLHPIYFPADKWISNRLEVMGEENRYTSAIIKRELKKQSAESLVLDDPAHERYKYHWKPINVRIDCDLQEVKFLTDIAGLPKTDDTEVLYNELTHIFQKMLPAFQSMGVVKMGLENHLQVIIKAQMYRIDPGTSYEGKWHTEGVTERIVAVGSYYTHVDSFLDGGALEFSLKNFPDKSYAKLRYVGNYPDISLNSSYEFEDESFVEGVDVRTGSAIVFSNELPHRFQKIVNTTDQKGFRVFVNFFVVDPKHPLTLGHEQSSLDQKDIMEQRERIREVLVRTQKGWGHIHYGNVGEVGYVDRCLFGKPITNFRDVGSFIDDFDE